MVGSTQVRAPAFPIGKTRLIPTARNLAILQEVRSALAATLIVSDRESAIRQIEADAATAPQRRLLSHARSRWAWRIGILFAALDVAAVAVAWLVTPTPNDALTLLLTALAMIVICNRADLHRSRFELAVLDDVPAYLLATVVGGLAVAGVGSLSSRAPPRLSTCVIFCLVVFALLVLSRVVAFPIVRRLRRGRLIAHPVVIVGVGGVGQRLASAMRAHPEYGLKPVGFVDFESSLGRRGEPVLPMLGDITSLAQILRQFDAHDVIFAFSEQADAHMVRIVRSCVRMDLQVFVVPRYFEMFGTNRRARIETLWGVPLIRLRRWPMRRRHRWTKRLIDVVMASAVLVVLSPVMLACALAVRAGGGPVLFKQNRIGRDGRTFMLYKFRSMTATGHDGERCWSVIGDMRVTPVGRVLRWSSLDELPQLINVLRGDMSLVGPRPERPYFVESFSRRIYHYVERHRVETGMTGWAQVNGLRGDTSIQDRVNFDNYYIDNWSLWNDIKIILRTATSLMRHEPKTEFVAAPRTAVPETRAS